MPNDYLYDAFLSFVEEDKAKVKSIYDKMIASGLNVFWAPESLEAGTVFPDELASALQKSQNFVLYWSQETKRSKWVKSEYNAFLNLFHESDNDDQRSIYVLLDDPSNSKDVPLFLKSSQYPKSSDELIAALVKSRLTSAEKKFEQATEEQNRRIIDLQHQLEQAQSYFRYHRFWGVIAENRDVHIFTCARDVPYDKESTRGLGGRSNIDVWDFRAVFDIIHFFASNYPNTKVTIEDPVSKLQGDILDDGNRMTHQIDHMIDMLVNKDCIIIGSPDVSDFAELVLAQIHQIDPYVEDRIKKKGFVIIKGKKLTRSSFYWAKEEEEEEGIAEIQDGHPQKHYPHVLAVERGNYGTMYGILVVANNPFCDFGQRKKIVILSGFSGVATNAIAKMLTDEKWLDEFFKFDRDYTDTNRDIEVLIGVDYVIDARFGKHDTRKIRVFNNAITFKGLVEI